MTPDLAGGWVELLTGAGTIATAVLTLAGVLWWLVWPRVEDKLTELVRGVHAVEGALDDERPDTVGRHARTAARELPAIRSELAKLHAWQDDTDDWRARVDWRLDRAEGALMGHLPTTPPPTPRGNTDEKHDS